MTLANDQYHEDDGYINSSRLGVFLESKRDYFEQFITKKMPRKAANAKMKTGSILHALLLEKLQAADVFEIYPSSCFKKNGHRNPGPAAEFEASLGGRYALTSKESDTIFQCFEAVYNSPLGEIIRDRRAIFETRVNAELILPAKCKPDILLPISRIIYDLKFGEVKPDQFKSNIKRFRYWLQHAHYRAVCQFALNRDFEFHWWAIETKYPFRIQKYSLSQRSAEIARDSHAKALNDLALAHERDDWTDNWPVEINLDQWDFRGAAEGEVEIEYQGDDLSDDNTKSFVAG